MKTLLGYINESEESKQIDWITPFIDEIKALNTEGKLTRKVALWTTTSDQSTRVEVYWGTGELMKDENDVDRHMNSAIVTAFVEIYVCTTEKRGNMYGIVKDYNVKNNTQIMQLFNKRVKGASDMVFTDSIDNVKKYLEMRGESWIIKKKGLNPELDGSEGYFSDLGVFTSKEAAEVVAKKYSKKHHINVKIRWYNAKADEVRAVLEQNKKNIKYYEEQIERTKNEIKELESQIKAWEEAKELTGKELNESLEFEDIPVGE